MTVYAPHVIYLDCGWEVQYAGQVEDSDQADAFVESILDAPEDEFIEMPGRTESKRALVRVSTIQAIRVDKP